jgi:glucokinase-like ROK family protein
MQKIIKPPANRSNPNTAPFVINKHEAEIIQLLQQYNEISRTDLARMIGWSRAKITQEIDGLIKRSLVVEVGEGNSEGGRKPRLLSINNNLGFLVGVDIGMTSLDIALADVCGQVLERRSEPADVRDAPEKLLGRCCELISEMLAAVDGPADKVLGIGIGVPGPVEFSKGLLVAPPAMPLWERYPIRDYFRKTFKNTYVVVDNDVNIMALAELREGDGRGLDHFIFIKIGTGIGCGIVSNGKIHRGADGCAGDIGHICVDKNGPICSCGNLGCLEAVTAGPAIAERAIQAAREGSSPVLARKMEQNGGVLTAEDVGAALREGDRKAMEIVQFSGRVIGETLASLVNFFNPSYVFFGGGVTNLGNQLLSSIRQAVLNRSLPLATRHLVIDYSSMGADTGITGAFCLAKDHLFMTVN